MNRKRLTDWAAIARRVSPYAPGYPIPTDPCDAVAFTDEHRPREIRCDRARHDDVVHRDKEAGTWMLSELTGVGVLVSIR